MASSPLARSAQGQGVPITPKALAPVNTHVVSRGFNSINSIAARVPISQIPLASPPISNPTPTERVPLPSGNPPNGTSATNGVKRKRESMAGLDHSSPGSPGPIDDEHTEHEKKRQPGVKRACNECRQQKLRCTVVQDPFHPCQRCTRLGLECKIESNFKRVGKRSKHAEMEKEIERLRRCLQLAKDSGFIVPKDEDSDPSPTTDTARNASVVSDEPNNAVSNGNNNVTHRAESSSAHELGDVHLTDEDVRGLFVEYFSYYHQFLPFLNPATTPEVVKMQHPLLFWVIISVAARRWSDKSLLSALASPLNKLVWNTIGEVPSNYHIVKALCLLCTWPLPTSSSAADPTHVLCGVMMKVATMIGLHRPNNMRDFSRVDIDLDHAQLNDRVITWAVCNIVAQNVGTGYGQPASTIYDWTLAMGDSENSPLRLPRELEARVCIERFCDKVSKEMYSNLRDPRGVAGDEHRAMLLRLFKRDFTELQVRVLKRISSPMVNLHLAAANFHLRLAGFYDASSTPNYLDDLMSLYRSTESFIKQVLEVDKVTSPSDTPNRGMLSHCTNFIQQTLVAAGFTLLKLLKSFFVRVIDGVSAKKLFNETIEAIRSTSVVKNDLQSRLAELMVQMWNGTADPEISDSPDESPPLAIDDSLQLKVRCRHSMSVVFDTIWRWREDFQAKGRGDLDTLERPPSLINPSTMPPTNDLADLVPTPTAGMNFMNNVLENTLAGQLANGPVLDSLVYNPHPLYDQFNPTNWMLDDLVDFQFNYPLSALDS